MSLMNLYIVILTLCYEIIYIAFHDEKEWPLRQYYFSYDLFSIYLGKI